MNNLPDDHQTDMPEINTEIQVVFFMQRFSQLLRNLSHIPVSDEQTDKENLDSQELSVEKTTASPVNHINQR